MVSEFCKCAENRPSHGSSIYAAALRKEYYDGDFRLLRWCVAYEEAVRLLRAARDGSACFSDDIHSVHESSMRHAKGDGVFQPFKDGRVDAKIVLALTKRQLAVGFEQFERCDHDATIAKRFELQILEIGRQCDSAAGFLPDKP